MANARLAPTVIPLLSQLSSEPGYQLTHWFYIEDEDAIFKFVPGDTTTADGVDVIDSASGVIGRFKRIPSPRLTASLRVRGVVYSNVASTSAFTVASDDSITYVEDDRILLVSQTTAANNGIWVVGAVTAGVAALSRPSDWLTGTAMPQGAVVEVGTANGLTLRNSSWKCTGSSAGLIGTNDPLLYPQRQKFVIDLAAGTYTIGAGGDSDKVVLYGACSVQVTPRTLSNSALTVHYVPSTITTGAIGTAAITVQAQTEAGALNAADTSSLDVLVTNW